MKEIKKVILPGSYDPVTLGHLEIIKRAAEQYDEVLAVGFINPDKEYLFSEEQRLRMLEISVQGMDNVKTDLSRGLVIDYMKKTGAELIVKGYRNERDYEYELVQARWNEEHGGYKTELIKCEAGFENISSTAAREAIEHGDKDEALQFLPKGVADYIFEVLKA